MQKRRDFRMFFTPGELAHPDINYLDFSCTNISDVIFETKSHGNLFNKRFYEIICSFLMILLFKLIKITLKIVG